MHERHGGSFTPEYESWSQARKRCFSSSNKDYAKYGGRGISMCPEWADSFAAFRMDMGPRPSMTHTLEREDVNGNYDPSNCAWATVQTQNENKRTTIRVQFACREMTLKAACAAAEVSYPATWHWMRRHGATFYQAIAR